MYAPSGVSSTTHGYSSGGWGSSNSAQNIIDKFTFSSDANATDVGDLTVSKGGSMGSQF